MNEKQTPFEQREMKKRSMFMEAMNRLLCNRSAVFGLVILLAMILLCAFAEIICPEGYNAQNIPDAFCQPFENYFLGTDNLGRSMLARILYGGRNSLLIGFAATLIAAITGVILGMLAAFYGGRVDNIIMRGMDVLNSIPNLLLAVLVSACLGNGTINTMIAVAVFKHILPNILSPIIVQFTMGTAISILCVSSLSFIGMGIQPPIPEWGGLLSAGRQYITRYPYLCIEPGIAIALVVFSMNLFGDGLRDALDPRLKK